MSKGKILVAPLNWGLGHATRCIPIIKALQEEGFSPVVASDGKALSLLQHEFPDLKFYELPELKIKYTKRRFWLKFRLVMQFYKFFKSFKEERKLLKTLDKDGELKGIISDNRFGFYHSSIPCAIITHQLKVYSGSTTWLSSLLHQFFLSKYDECWVPDRSLRPHMSGKLGHLKASTLKIKYIGFLSRFQYREVDNKYDILILISGPEPQRSMFETIMLKEFSDYQGKVVLVRGIVEDEQDVYEKNGITVYNFLKGEALETLLLESKVVIGRSGYTNLMDFGALRKNAILIPTPGQPEQQYLAKSMKKHGVVPYSQQYKFSLNMVHDYKFYNGLHSLFIENDINFRDAFRLFERK